MGTELDAAYRIKAKCKVFARFCAKTLHLKKAAGLENLGIPGPAAFFSTH